MFWYASTDWTPTYENEKLSGFIFEIRDISWKKINEDVLRASEERMTMIFESTSDRIAVWDREGTYIYANNAELEFHSLPRNKVIGQKFNSIYDKKNISKWNERLVKCFNNKKITRFENKYYKNKFYHYDEVVMSPIYQNENIYAVAVMHRDITDRKYSEKQLKDLNQKLIQSNSELEQFAYVASHDLQEPLRAISGYIQLIQKRYSKKIGEGSELIDRATSAAERMRSLIEDLLSLSRVTTHAGRFRKIDLNKVLQRIEQNLSFQIAERKAIISYPEMPEIIADLSQMNQLLQNIISNGIKFNTSDKPEVKINFISNNNNFKIICEDNGIGIQEEYIERVFRIFQRLHTRDEYPGTGIGLAICKKIVERHDGSIDIESVPGEGSKFIITLPFLEEN